MGIILSAFCGELTIYNMTRPHNEIGVSDTPQTWSYSEKHESNTILKRNQPNQFNSIELLKYAIIIHVISFWYIFKNNLKSTQDQTRTRPMHLSELPALIEISATFCIIRCYWTSATPWETLLLKIFLFSPVTAHYAEISSVQYHLWFSQMMAQRD